MDGRAWQLMREREGGRRAHQRRTRMPVTLVVMVAIQFLVGSHAQSASDVGADVMDTKLKLPKPPPPRRRRSRSGIGGGGEGSRMAGVAASTLGDLVVSEAVRAASDSTCLSRATSSLSSCDFRNRQSLRWRYGAGDDASNCDETLPEDMNISCDHVAWWSEEGIAIVMLSALGMGVSLFFWMALSRYRKSRTVRLGQPTFCFTFVIGVGISCLAALTLLGQNNDLSCSLRVWVWSAGFDIAFGALALKLWRVLSVVENSLKFRRVSLTTRKVQAFLALLLLSDVAILTSWTVTSGGKHSTLDLADATGASVEGVSCMTHRDGHLYAWVIFKVALVLFCCYMSFKTWKIQSALAESGAIAMATYNLAVAGLFVAAVYWADANAQVCATTEAFAMVLAGVGALCTILAPKLISAKEELEGKALIGPSAAGCSSDGDGGPGAMMCNGSMHIEAGEAAVADGNYMGGAGGINTIAKTPRSGSRGISSSGHVVPFGDTFVTPHSTRSRRSARNISKRVSTPSSRTGRNRSTSRPGSPPLLAADEEDGDEVKGDGSDIEVGGGNAGCRPMPLAAGFCTPPARERLCRSVGGNGGTNSSGDSRIRGAQSARAGTFFPAGSDQSQSHSERGRGRGHRARSGAGRSAVGSGSWSTTSGGRPLSEKSTSKPPLSSVSNSSRRAHRSSGGGGLERGRSMDASTRTSSFSKSRSKSRSSRGDGRALGGSGDLSLHAHPPQNTAVLRRSRTTVRDNCSLSPLTLAMNGDSSLMFLGGGTGGSVSTASATTQESRKSARGLGSRSLKRRSSGSGIASKSRERERASSESGASQQADRGRRTSAAGSLVMFADSGTRLFCPHCEKEVAGCGFKGCSGSLVRAPSFSDDDMLDRRRSSMPLTISQYFPGSSLSVQVGGGAGGVAGSGANLVSPPAASKALRRRMSFRRGPSPADTFDTETDSMDEGGIDRSRSSATAASGSPVMW